MNVRLIVKSGAAPGAYHLRLPAVIGRSPATNLKIKHHHVSRRHCELLADSGELCVRDLGSANGTIVNGRSIGAQLTLRPGDELTLGSVCFRVDFEPTSIDGGAAPVAVEAPAQAEAAAEASARVTYAETPQGSFVGIQFEEHPLEIVGDEICFDFAPADHDDLSRVDLQLDQAAETPVDDDSRLNDFLRGLADR